MCVLVNLRSPALRQCKTLRFSLITEAMENGRVVYASSEVLLSHAYLLLEVIAATVNIDMQRLKHGSRNSFVQFHPTYHSVN